jgi:hypothetical protein
MTDKQIIIDGIDVSGCKFIDEWKHCNICKELKDGHCLVVADIECKTYQDCYYKQLKRKEQEYEELKNFLNEGCLHNLTLMTEQRILLQTLAEIKEIAKGENPAFLDNDDVVLAILQKISECEVVDANN